MKRGGANLTRDTANNTENRVRLFRIAHTPQFGKYFIRRLFADGTSVQYYYVRIGDTFGCRHSARIQHGGDAPTVVHVHLTTKSFNKVFFHFCFLRVFE